MRPAGQREALERATVTRWGHTNLLGGIRKKPIDEPRKAIGKLRWNTEDGLPEVYLVLESPARRERARSG